MDLLFPHKGFSKGLGAEKQPAGTTPWIQNMRVIDCQDNRFRGGQRGGLKKAYSERISSEDLVAPVVLLITITTVD